MKMKRLLVAVLTICMLATGMIGNLNIAQAEEGPTLIADDENTNIILKPGEKTQVMVPFKITGNFVYVTNIMLKDQNDNSPFIFSRPV